MSSSLNLICMVKLRKEVQWEGSEKGVCGERAAVSCSRGAGASLVCVLWARALMELVVW